EYSDLSGDARRSPKAAPAGFKTAQISSKNFFTPSNQLFFCGECFSPVNDAWNFISSSFCSLLRFTGVSTCTRHNRSPAGPPRTGVTPLPRRRNNLPLWVSAGIFSFTRPSRVGRAHV